MGMLYEYEGWEDRMPEQKDDWKKLPHILQVADRLHDLMCHSNHTDECDWFYHTWSGKDNTYNILEIGHAKKRYLDRAYSVVASAQRYNVDDTTLLELIGAMKGY